MQEDCHCGGEKKNWFSTNSFCLVQKLLGDVSQQKALWAVFPALLQPVMLFHVSTM